jgi:PKD repeat protein
MATLARTLTRTFVFAAILAAAGCGLDEKHIPSLSGPSGLSLDVTISATPEFLPRDGVSSALINVLLRDGEGRPVPQRALRLTAVSSPGTGGKLQATEAETDVNGRVAIRFTAPTVNDNVNEVTIAATPLTGNTDTNLTHTVRIRVVGPSIPIPNFTFSPATPQQFEKVAFDAMSTTLGGGACAGCTYEWTFGDEATGTGSFVQYQFQKRGSYPVTLTVTSSAGASAQVTKVVPIGAPTRPTAAFVVSPTNPLIGETIFFNAAASRSPNGYRITKFKWDFGNGHGDTTSEPITDMVYDVARTYTVTLVVEDENGVESEAVVITVTPTAPVVVPVVP